MLFARYTAPSVSRLTEPSLTKQRELPMGSAVLAISMLSAAPVASYVASWLVLGFGTRYSRARPLGLRILRIGFASTLLELTVMVIWAIVRPSTLSPTFAGTTMVLALLTIPASLVWLAIDTRREGVPATKDDRGDAC